MLNYKKIIYRQFFFFSKFLFGLNLFYFKNFSRYYNQNLYDCKIYILTHGNKDRLKYLNFFLKYLNVILISKNDEKFSFALKKKIILNVKTPTKKVNTLLSTLKKFKNYISKNNYQLNEFMIKKDIRMQLLDFKFTKTQISNTFKHLVAWKYAVKSPESYILVLEDDVIFRLNSFERLHCLLLNLPKNADFICLAGGSLIKSSKILKNNHNKNLFNVTPGLTRTICGYIISKKFLSKIFSSKHKFNLPIDFELNYLFYKKKASVYWTEPTIFIHGSVKNAYSSTNYQNS